MLQMIPSLEKRLMEGSKEEVVMIAELVLYNQVIFIKSAYHQRRFNEVLRALHLMT